MVKKPEIPLEDTDVLWKPPRMGTRMRTISTDSADSAANEAPQPHRRFSISEFFGIRRPSVSTEASTSVAAGVVAPERRGSITESYDFKEFVKRSRRLVDDH